MNILFIATTGVHHALIAAYMYLDPLNTENYRHLKYFDNYELEISGKPLYLGMDSSGNRVFSLGVGSDVGMVKKSIEQLSTILDAKSNELQIIPIVIKSQWLILILQRASRLGVLKSLSSVLINYLLKRDLPAIYDQLKQVSVLKTAG